jgi:2-C-methyl-D-erythritol 4-phosphate cytidylyltransferase
MIRTLLKRVSLPQTRTITTLKSILNQTSNTASKADDAAAVNAFSQRTGLIFSNQHVLIDALTHKSITEKSTQYHILGK